MGFRPQTIVDLNTLQVWFPVSFNMFKDVLDTKLMHNDSSQNLILLGGGKHFDWTRVTLSVLKVIYWECAANAKWLSHTASAQVTWCGMTFKIRHKPGITLLLRETNDKPKKGGDLAASLHRFCPNSKTLSEPLQIQSRQKLLHDNSTLHTAMTDVRSVSVSKIFHLVSHQKKESGKKILF